MDLPEWVDELWSELRFAELAARESGEGFQRLFQRVMKAADGESFLEVRPVGKYGDFKCDGWDTSSQTCYAVYGPFTRKTPDEVLGPELQLGPLALVDENMPVIAVAPNDHLLEKLQSILEEVRARGGEL